MIKGRIQRIFRPSVKGLEKLWQLLRLLLEQVSLFQTYLHISKGKASLLFLLRSLLIIFFSLYFVQPSYESMKHYFSLLPYGFSTSLKVWNFNQDQQRMNSQMIIFIFPTPWEDIQQSKKLFIVSFFASDVFS